MRAVTVFAAVVVSVAASAQGTPPHLSVFLTVKPDVWIIVTKQPLGPDLVDVSIVNAAYPPQLLQDQLAAFGKYLGAGIRGLRVYRHAVDAKQPSMTFLSAQFATDGIIDRERGKLRILPFLQAFAGAPAPYTVHGLTVEFSGEQATERTIRKYATSSVRAEAISSPEPKIEYRIELLSQDPHELSFPEEYTKSQQEPAPAPPANRTALILGLFAVAAVAGGALVYLALLRGAPQARVKPR